MMTNVQEESGDHARLILLKGKRTKRQRSSSPLTNAATAGTITEEHNEITTGEDEDMANCLMLLSQGHSKTNRLALDSVYHCKTCDKSFLSFQALGGHRASHKKLKLASASAVETLVDAGFLSLQVSNGESNKKVEKIHECSICKAEFSSGQALGGHMRRHRGLVFNSSNQESSKQRSKSFLELDLNLPAPEDERSHEKPRFTFASKDQILVFNSFIDCHH